MRRIRIFISSVQVEFKKERLSLYEYLRSDPLLGTLFDPFLFELLPSEDRKADRIYLKEVERCEIYLGILGKSYGHEVNNGISPTEREFDHATLHHKTRLIFISNHSREERHPKQAKFIAKAEEALVRKRFTTTDELKSSVYAALVRYLREKDIIRTGPFDASFNGTARLDDLDSEKIIRLVRIAREKRGFPLALETPVKDILTHLDLMVEDRITNAAILLFGKLPQRFFISSEIRCAHFHGTEVAKPIPSLQVYKGTVLDLVDQAVDFVLSKINYSVGTRSEQVQIPGSYEIPKEIVAEAIVNAVAHRDYTSNGSVQVMLFRDRLEVWNPGSLPLGWTTEKLKQAHNSVPANPLIASPMYLGGYIERIGTGTRDMIRIAHKAGLREPDFVQDTEFRAIIYRPTGEATGEATGEVKRLAAVLDGEMRRSEIQEILQLKHDEHFRLNYITPAIEQGVIEMTHPENLNHPNQKYRLTIKGKQLKREG